MTYIVNGKVYVLRKGMYDLIRSGEVESCDLTEESAIDGSDLIACNVDPASIKTTTVEERIDKALALQEKASKLDDSAMATLERIMKFGLQL